MRYGMAYGEGITKQQAQAMHLEHVCIDVSIQLLQVVKYPISNEALRVRMKEIGEELIRVAEET